MLSVLGNVLSEISVDTLLRQIHSSLNASVPEHRGLSGSLNVICGKSLSLPCVTLRLPLMNGNVYDEYQANVPAHKPQPFWCSVSW